MRRLALLGAALLALVASVSATTFTQTFTANSTAYVDLGAGPVDVVINSNVGATFVVSDAQPAVTAAGPICAGGQSTRYTFCQTSHVWAKAPPTPYNQPAMLAVTPTSCGGAAGTTGNDYSANKPTLPNVGSAFAASGPYASYALISTAPVSAS